MFDSLISATFGYVDIAILILVGLFIIVGLIRGFAKSLKGFFLVIAIILCSMLLLGVTFQPIRETPTAGKLDTALQDVSRNWGPGFNDPVYLQDGRFTVLHDGEFVELGKIDGIKGKIANLLAKQFAPENGETMASVVTGNITSLIVAIILFICYCIGFGILCALFRLATKKMHYSESSGIKIADRIGGGLVAGALGFMFVLVILAIFSALQNKIPSVIDYIQNSTIGKFFYDMNPIGKVFADIFVK